MRPPNCFGGNSRRARRRKCRSRCFNEAAELLRRKRVAADVIFDIRVVASMRPPNCFGGNPRISAVGVTSRYGASMRPPNCFGGNSSSGGKYMGTETGFNEAAELLRRKR